MNMEELLPTELIYKCLFYLGFKEYYQICKWFNMKLRFSLYVRECKQTLITDVDVKDVKCLKNFGQQCINLACEEYKNELDEIKEVYDKNENLEIFSYLFAIDQKYINVIRYDFCNCIDIAHYLYDNGYNFNQLDIYVACSNGYTEYFKYLFEEMKIDPCDADIQCAMFNGHIGLYYLYHKIKKIDDFISL